MEITEVRIKMMDGRDEKLRAFCTITFQDEFVVRDIKIIEGGRGPFVAMPSRKVTDHCTRCGGKNHLRARYCNDCGARLSSDRLRDIKKGRTRLHTDIAHPINAVCREKIQARVVEAYEEEKARCREPGYRPPDLEDDRLEGRREKKPPLEKTPPLTDNREQEGSHDSSPSFERKRPANREEERGESEAFSAGA
jgi:stage V sporulation protein G